MKVVLLLFVAGGFTNFRFLVQGCLAFSANKSLFLFIIARLSFSTFSFWHVKL